MVKLETANYKLPFFNIVPSTNMSESSMIENCVVVCLMSQPYASESQGQICSDKFTCCHTEIEVADQTFYLTQSQYMMIGKGDLRDHERVCS